MNESLTVLIKRAQEMANKSGTPRWVKYTSLGWRIEWTPPGDEDDGLTQRCDPQPPPKNA